MASFEEHCRDCERLLGDRCEDVNRWMDAEFARFGPLHRFSRHHARGIGEAAGLFGERGLKAASIHILKDCGHIPTARAWKNREVDTLGMDPAKPFAGYWDPKQFDQAARKLLGI